MATTRVQPKNAWEREMLRKELLIDWRNYPKKDAVLDDKEVEDWLGKIEDCLRMPIPGSR